MNYVSIFKCFEIKDKNNVSVAAGQSNIGMVANARQFNLDRIYQDREK